MIFGVTHTDPKYIQMAVEQFAATVGSEKYQCESGPQYAMCCAAKSDGRLHGLFADASCTTLLSGEITSQHPVACTITDEKKHYSHAALFGALFQKLGSDAVSATSGQFCAAVWNKENRALSLFLDRSGGIKVLYYTQLTNGFAFCSSLNVLLSTVKIQRQIEPEAVSDLFATGYVVPPNTVIKHVYKVCPGQEIQFYNEAIQARIVDRIHFDSSSQHLGSVDQLEEKLLVSLSRYAYEPETGFLLSGGIDSSILVALASKHIRKPITTFTAAFPGSSLDESAYAKIVAEDNGCIYQEVDLSGSAALDDLPEIVWHLGEPFLDFSAIPSFHLFKAVSTNTQFLISGDGPDHLFGRYYPLAAKRYVAHKYNAFAKLGALLPLTFPQKILRAGAVSLSEAYRGLFALPAWGDGHSTLHGLLKVPVDDASRSIERFAALYQVPAESTLESYVDAVTTLDFYLDGTFGVFTKIGRMADAHGLVIREPFLERGVSDYIAQLPLHQKQAGSLLHLLSSRSRDKQLLKTGLGRKYLPEAVLNKKKGGFTPPLGGWLRETVCLLPAAQIFCQTLRSADLINETVFDKMLQEHQRGQRNWAQIVFLIISFDLWVRMFIESEHSAFPGWKLKDVYPV